MAEEEGQDIIFTEDAAQGLEICDCGPRDVIAPMVEVVTSLGQLFSTWGCCLARRGRAALGQPESVEGQGRTAG